MRAPAAPAKFLFTYFEAGSMRLRRTVPVKVNWGRSPARKPDRVRIPLQIVPARYHQQSSM